MGFWGEGDSRINFIWLGPSGADPNSTYVPQQYAVMDNLVDSTLMSDHRPVTGVVSQT